LRQHLKSWLRPPLPTIRDDRHQRNPLQHFEGRTSGAVSMVLTVKLRGLHFMKNGMENLQNIHTIVFIQSVELPSSGRYESPSSN